MQRTGYTRASTLGPIADVVASNGGSIDRVFRLAELPVRLLEEPDRLVPLRDHFRLLATAARELRDEAFAARLGRRTSIAGLGVYGKWVTQAPTLSEALHRAGTSLPHMIQTATWLVVRQAGTEVHWSYVLADPATEGRQHNELLALSYMIAVVRHFAGPGWRPDRVILGGLPASLGRSIGRQMGADTQIRDTPGTIVFDRRLLTAVNPTLRPTDGLGSRELARILDIPAPDDLPGHVRALIDLELLDGRPEIARVAGRAGLSKRTLQRRLGELGLRFSDLLKSTLQRRAVELLCRPDCTITEIALRLGYQDPAHFSRAFEAWTGMSPSRWRDVTAASGTHGA